MSSESVIRPPRSAGENTRTTSTKTRKHTRIRNSNPQQSDGDIPESRKRHKGDDNANTSLPSLLGLGGDNNRTVSATRSKRKAPTTKRISKKAFAGVPAFSSQMAPDNWEEVYAIIKAMRSRITAPADLMGCEQSKYKESDPKNSRFTTLVYLILSSQTKDEITDAAVTRLKEAVGGVLSVDAVIATDESVISESVNKVGFWRRKSGYIKQVAQRLRDKFESDVPKTFDELCSLPGVGPKMAILVLHVAWDINQGIGVDSHVHRLTNRLGWHKTPTKNAEETRSSLQSWLPSELHREINLMLVGFGQVVCTPIKPRCDTCKLSTKGLCPSAQITGTKSKYKDVDTPTQHSASLPRLSVELETEG